MTQKYSYEFVEKYFEERECEMLDDEYNGSDKKIRYKCSCGNISRTTFKKFKTGHRCKKCAILRNSKKRTFSFDYVFNYFKDRGCYLLDREYVSSKIRMEYRCGCGDVSKTSFRNFKKSSRCRKCADRSRSGSNNYQWVEDRVAHEERKKFRDKCYKMLRNSLKSTRQSKNSRTHLMLGYFPEDLQRYIKNHSNWESVKDDKWHLDHIFPIQAFVDYEIKDTKLINCLENLQPLESRENISKNDYYDEEKFEEWLKGKGYAI